jgi:hypothetical protein
LGDHSYWDSGALSFAPTASFLVANDIAAPMHLQMVSFHVQLSWQVTTASGGAVPGSAGVAMIFGIQVVDHGVGPTTVTDANLFSGPWIYSGYLTVDNLGISRVYRGDGSIVSDYWATGHEEFLTGMFYEDASDIYVQLSWDGHGFYGVTGDGIVTGHTVYSTG